MIMTLFMMSYISSSNFKFNSISHGLHLVRYTVASLTYLQFSSLIRSLCHISLYLIIFLFGGYYLVDSGYPCTLGFLPLYCTERYHLQDFWGRDHPEGVKELFNYRHSFLHNVIERCFGILKARFLVLKMMPCYKPCRQGNVMRVCCTIHNFIWMVIRNDRLFTQFNIDNLTIEGEGRNNSGEPLHTVDLTNQVAKTMATYRDQIARLMLANNRHHWCHIIIYLSILDEIDSLALMPRCKLFSYWLSFIKLDNCYSFNLTYIIKFLGLNVIYKTIDL